MRDTYKYVIKQGNLIVYIGITNDLGRRAAEHRNSGKVGKLEQVGNKTTFNAASQWERERLATYRRGHGGQNPLYNKTDHG